MLLFLFSFSLDFSSFLLVPHLLLPRAYFFQCVMLLASSFSYSLFFFPFIFLFLLFCTNFFIFNVSALFFFLVCVILLLYVFVLSFYSFPPGLLRCLFFLSYFSDVSSVYLYSSVSSFFLFFYLT